MLAQWVGNLSGAMNDSWESIFEELPQQSIPSAVTVSNHRDFGKANSLQIPVPGPPTSSSHALCLPRAIHGCFSTCYSHQLAGLLPAVSISLLSRHT